MLDSVPTVYTERGAPTKEVDHQVPVRLPVDVAEELMVVTVWLSLRLGHKLPVDVLRRALVLGGLTRTDRVLADLRGTLRRPD